MFGFRVPKLILALIISTSLAQKSGATDVPHALETYIQAQRHYNLLVALKSAAKISSAEIPERAVEPTVVITPDYFWRELQIRVKQSYLLWVETHASLSQITEPWLRKSLGSIESDLYTAYENGTRNSLSRELSTALPYYKALQERIYLYLDDLCAVLKQSMENAREELLSGAVPSALSPVNCEIATLGNGPHA